MPDVILDSLAAGLDDFTSPSELAKDACTVAENVEFFYSSLGERRKGCVTIDPHTTDIQENPALLEVVWLHEHQPTNVESNTELWICTRNTGNVPLMFRLIAGGYHTVAFPFVADGPDLSGAARYEIYGQSLHGKLFIAYKSSVDRLHVWDGSILRRAGLAAHAAGPTIANTGAGAYAAIIRYYRTRSIAKSGATVLRRSEPSVSTAFTPSGAGAAARVTRPTVVDEGETHWEVEVSLDNAAFYRLSQVLIATTTYDDSAVVSSYSSNTLSDAVGVYATIPSVKYLSSDGDRLLLGGSWTTEADSAAVRWTPVGNDPSPGPDERLNTNTDPRVDLDGQEGGHMSSLSRVVSGSLFAFKRHHIYKLIRTGQLVGAYEAIPVTKARGAFPKSVVEANDEGGRPAQYFLDPDAGPMRAGSDGLQFVGYNVQALWRRVNRAAILPCHGVYYNDKHQIHYWLALDGADYPNTKIVLQTNDVETDSHGGRRGWTTVPSPNRIAAARCSAMFAQQIYPAPYLLNRVPFIGKAIWSVGGSDVLDVLQRCDSGQTDADSSGDTLSAYTAKVRSRPFFLTNILNRHGIMAGSLLGSAGSRVLVTARRDFGVETLAIAANMSPVGSEAYVIAHLDNFSFSELYAIELEFADDPDHITDWQLVQFAMKGRSEETS